MRFQAPLAVGILDSLDPPVVTSKTRENRRWTRSEGGNRRGMRVTGDLNLEEGRREREISIVFNVSHSSPHPSSSSHPHLPHIIRSPSATNTIQHLIILIHGNTNLIELSLTVIPNPIATKDRPYRHPESHCHKKTVLPSSRIPLPQKIGKDEINWQSRYLRQFC